VTNTIDPLAGSYYVEKLTDELEAEAEALIKKIDEMRGVVAAIEQGFIQKQIEESSYRFGQSIETGDRIIVGVNKFQSKDEGKVELFEVPEATQQRQIDKVKNIKATRDNAKVEAALKLVVDTANGTGNLMPPILEAVKAYATLGEISKALANVFGEYTESNS